MYDAGGKSRWGRPDLKDHSDPLKKYAGNKRAGNLFNTCVPPQCPSKPECEGLKIKQGKI